MFRVQNMTSDPKQAQTLVLPDGTFINLTIQYFEQQLGWFIIELSYVNFLIRGVRICNSPNLLYQYKNQIPFGLACFSLSTREPTLKEDFLSGASKLYVLDATDVAAYTEYLSG